MEGALAGDETSYAPYQEFVDKVIAASPYQISCRLASTIFGLKGSVSKFELGYTSAAVAPNGKLAGHFAQDQFAQFVAILVVHVHEFHAVPARGAVADNRGAMNFLPQAGSHFQLHGLSNRKSV